MLRVAEATVHDRPTQLGEREVAWNGGFVRWPGASDLGEPGREKHPVTVRETAGIGVHNAEQFKRRGLVACFLEQLGRRGLLRRLTRVDMACGELKRLNAEGRAVLPDHHHAPVRIERDDGDVVGGGDCIMRLAVACGRVNREHLDPRGREANVAPTRLGLGTLAQAEHSPKVKPRWRAVAVAGNAHVADRRREKSTVVSQYGLGGRALQATEITPWAEPRRVTGRPERPPTDPPSSW